MKVPPTLADPTPKQEREHEAALQRQILDWVTVLQPKRGDVLVLRVPDEYFVMPGTPQEDITEEQKAMLDTAGVVLTSLVQGCERQGIVISGATILGENMNLEALPNPYVKPLPEPDEHIVVPGKRLLLPPGTKI